MNLKIKLNHISIKVSLSLFYCIITYQGFAANYVFTNSGGNRLWSNANNWSPVGVPQSVDNITVDLANDSLIIDTNVSINQCTLTNNSKIFCEKTFSPSVLYFQAGTVSGIDSLLPQTIIIRSYMTGDPLAHTQAVFKTHTRAQTLTWYQGDLIVGNSAGVSITNTTINFNFYGLGNPTFILQHLNNLPINLGNVLKNCATGYANILSPTLMTNLTALGWIYFNAPININGPIFLSNTTSPSTLEFKSGANSFKGLYGTSVSNYVRVKNGASLNLLVGNYENYSGNFEAISGGQINIANKLTNVTHNHTYYVQGGTLNITSADSIIIKGLVTNYDESNSSKALISGSGKLFIRQSANLGNSIISAKINTSTTCNTTFKSHLPPFSHGKGNLEITEEVKINGNLTWEGSNDSVSVKIGGTLILNPININVKASTANLIDNGGSVIFLSNNIYLSRSTANTANIKFDYPFPTNTYFTINGQFDLKKFSTTANSIIYVARPVKVSQVNFISNGAVVMAVGENLNILANGTINNITDSYFSTNGSYPIVSVDFATLTLTDTFKVSRLQNFYGQIIANNNFNVLRHDITHGSAKLNGFSNFIRSLIMTSGSITSDLNRTAHISLEASFKNDCTIGININTEDYAQIVLDLTSVQLTTGKSFITGQESETYAYFSDTIKGTGWKFNGKVILYGTYLELRDLADLDSTEVFLYGSAPNIVRFKSNLPINVKSVKGEGLVQVWNSPQIYCKTIGPGYDYGNLFFPSGNNVFDTSSLIYFELYDFDNRDSMTLTNGAHLNGKIKINLGSPQNLVPGRYVLINLSTTLPNLTYDNSLQFIFINNDDDQIFNPDYVWLEKTGTALYINILPQNQKVSKSTGLWSNLNTWYNSTLPDDDYEVIICPNHEVTFDLSNSIVSKLTVQQNGNLIINQPNILTIRPVINPE
ncbi:MAG: hypothetical protein IPK35_06015 [Saprospiraceae bacterium]|nr:hypothetical protein [Saprospiraceae bacterium]